MTYDDFEDDVKLMVEKSGPLAGTELLKNGVIQLIVPFLPLTREHVKACIIRELKRNGFENPLIKPGHAFISRIASKQTYWKNLYSNEGCHNIENIIKRYKNSKRI